MSRYVENRIDDAFRLGRIGRFRAWLERLQCAHSGAKRADDTVVTDGIDSWTEMRFACQRCGKSGLRNNGYGGFD